MTATRAMLPALVRTCPACGYCARNLMEADETVQPILEGEAYRTRLNDESLPPLANRFLCAAMIADNRISTHRNNRATCSRSTT